MESQITEIIEDIVAGKLELLVARELRAQLKTNWRPLTEAVNNAMLDLLERSSVVEIIVKKHIATLIEKELKDSFSVIIATKK